MQNCQLYNFTIFCWRKDLQASRLIQNYYGLYRPSSVCPADKRRDVMSRWSSIWWANLSFGTFVAFNGLPFRSCTFVDLSYLWLSNQRYIICIQIFSENCWLNIFHLLFKLPLEIRFYHGAISDHGLSIFKHADLFIKGMVNPVLTLRCCPQLWAFLGGWHCWQKYERRHWTF